MRHIIAVMFAIAAIGGQLVSANPDNTVVIISVESQREIDQLSRWLEPSDIDLGRGIVVADVGPMERAKLDEAGFQYRIDEQLGLRSHARLEYSENQRSGIPGFPCYRTVDETLTAGATLAQQYPSLAEWVDIGDSWEKTTPDGPPGADLMVLKITNENTGGGGDKPKIWVQGGVHARELVSPETVLRFGEYLLANYDIDPDVTWIVDHHEIHLLPLVNPDGRLRVEGGASWRKNTESLEHQFCSPSSYGADLNRNFSFRWDCCNGGSNNPCLQVYRGPSEASEPETMAIQDYLTAHFPDWRFDNLLEPAPDDATGVFVDIHSHGGYVLAAPGVWAPAPPNDVQILQLTRKLSWFADYEGLIGGLYTADGTAKDWAYGKLGMAAFTFELGTEFFESCAIFEDSIIEANIETLLYAARVARSPYLAPAGPEIIDPLVYPSALRRGDTVSLEVLADDTLFGPGQSSPSPSVEIISAVEFSIDELPDIAGTTSFDMVPLDGLYNSSSEKAESSFPTSNLAYGRHTAFFRARDSAGSWGPIRARFFWVLDSAQVGAVHGTVRSEGDGAGLAATVASGQYLTRSDPTNGHFELVLMPGVYDLEASAPAHHPAIHNQITVSAGEQVVLDFDLAPYSTSLFEDWESVDQGWEIEAPWALTIDDAYSATHSMTDSPTLDYGPGLDSSIVSPPLDFSAATSVVLQFVHRHNLADSGDSGRIEFSIDDGASFSPLETFAGDLEEWTSHLLIVPELAGVTGARLRFRFISDSAGSADGWHLDNIRIAPESIFQDDFETGDLAKWALQGP